mgnify:CR=1 FL=1
MGLDMYLKARKFVSNWDFREEEKPINQGIREAMGLGHRNDEDANVEVTIGIGYWRKANQIHKWFVDNCQDGVDDCRESYVTREKLEELLSVCKETMARQDANILPPQSGFFFGSTDVDEWYWNGIAHTIDILESVLNDRALDNWDFEYQSSW